MSRNERLDETLAHIARHWATLPVRGKEPASDLIRRTRGSTSWKTLRDRPASEDEVRAWHELDPTAGVAVITGEPSRVAVVDIDDEMAAPNLPASATVSTRRGRHFYYRCDEPTSSLTFPWGELRAEGCYVVAPPSAGYVWEIPPDEIGELADFSRAASLLTRICSTCYRDRESLPREPFQGHLASKDAAAALADLERSEPAALALAVALGAPDGVRVGEAFPCVLHPDRSPSASLWRREAGAHVLYRDWHSSRHGERGWLSLAAVRARQAGRHGTLGVPELSMWKRRLAHETGLLELAGLDIDASPPSKLEAVWSGFLLLVGLRWAIDPGPPAPFSARFASAWCGVPIREAHAATAELARLGFLRLAGHDPRAGRLWLPFQPTSERRTR